MTEAEVKRMKEALDHELNTLGELSEGEIADFFRRKGIKGKMGVAAHCPLARYLSQKLGAEVLVGVYYAWLKLPDRAAYFAPLPDSVWTFRVNFDLRQYPDLLDNES